MWYLLLAVAVLLLVARVRLREGLAPTPLIRAPDVEQPWPGGGGSTRVYGAAEQDRMWALMPPAVRNEFGEHGKSNLAAEVAKYYPTYEAMTHPLTDADLDAYVESSYMSAFRPTVKAILRTYFLEQVSPTDPPPPPPDTSTPVPSAAPQLPIEPTPPQPASRESGAPITVTIDVAPTPEANPPPGARGTPMS